jgi:DnaK suppressor protein
MKQEKIATLKQNIITQINIKLARLDYSRKDLSELEHGASDDLDQAQSMQTLETINRLNSDLSNDISKLKMALKSINSDDFGYCDTCGIDIEDRLEVNAAVTDCFDCGTIKEENIKRGITA